jgi:carbonic anhydrase
LRGDAVEDLLGGNQRFRDGQAQAPRRDPERRRSVAPCQSPLAAVLTCSDSRVPPEILFDQGLGDLFVVRTAGHVVDRGALGSLEYAVEHLSVPTLLVLGHSGCGAVAGALSGGHAPGAVDWVMAAIRPAVWATGMMGGDAIDNAAREHARRTAAEVVRQSTVLREAVERQQLRVLAAFYDLATGAAELL